MISAGFARPSFGVGDWKRGSRLVLVSLLLNGCISVGPDYVTPESDVATNWLEAAHERLKPDPVETLKWWEKFEDPVLNSLILQAYAQNPTNRSINQYAAIPPIA